MRKAIGLDRRRDPQRVLDVLHQIDADVVALQEADKRFGGRGSAVPHELIDTHGIYKPVHLGVRHKRPLEKARKHAERLLKINTRNIGWHGNAILVKKHVGVIDCAALELPTLEPRGAVMAELLIDDKPIRVVGMHLDLSGLWRKRQMRAILEKIAARPQRCRRCSWETPTSGEPRPDVCARSSRSFIALRPVRAFMHAARSPRSTGSSSTRI
jgi:endonuclease/exonuclease/phosphatase family metal-dependent hydrolase